MTTFDKDPDARLDFVWDWTDWLADTADVIVDSVFTCSNDSLQLAASTHDLHSATVWLDGGRNGTDYLVTNQITTRAGRRDAHTATVRVGRRLIA